MNFDKIIKFLKDLQNNNSKLWMDANRDEYTMCRKDWIELNEDLIGYIYTMDPSIGFVDPKSTLFRINRDIRFSHDKTPYNTHFSTLVKRGGRDSQFAGYYVRLDRDGNVMIGGGLMDSDPGTLNNFRVYLNREDNALKFKKIFPIKTMDVWTENNLKRIPNQFKDSTCTDLMLYKSFIQSYTFKHKTKEQTLKTIKEKLKKLKLFIEFINIGVIDKL